MSKGFNDTPPEGFDSVVPYFGDVRTYRYKDLKPVHVMNCLPRHCLAVSRGSAHHYIEYKDIPMLRGASHRVDIAGLHKLLDELGTENKKTKGEV